MRISYNLCYWVECLLIMLDPFSTKYKKRYAKQNAYEYFKTLDDAATIAERQGEK